jgi:hypothetical protein
MLLCDSPIFSSVSYLSSNDMLRGFHGGTNDACLLPSPIKDLFRLYSQGRGEEEGGEGIPDKVEGI